MQDAHLPVGYIALRHGRRKRRHRQLLRTALGCLHSKLRVGVRLQSYRTPSMPRRRHERLRIAPCEEAAKRRRGSAAHARSPTCDTRRRMSGSEPGRRWITRVWRPKHCARSPRNTRAGLCPPDGSVCRARLLNEHAPGLPHAAGTTVRVVGIYCRSAARSCGRWAAESVLGSKVFRRAGSARGVVQDPAYIYCQPLIIHHFPLNIAAALEQSRRVHLRFCSAGKRYVLLFRPHRLVCPIPPALPRSSSLSLRCH